jgi:Ca-activated chloride channel family protein
MSFGAGAWFWGMLLIPILLLLFFQAERRGAIRLREFVSPRLFSQLAGTVNRLARLLKFALLLAVLGFAFVALAQPRWGYTYDDTKRRGLDLILAVDTSRSMLSNDVQPNRLQRVRLATQDLINDLQGDRVGLIAFAGRAFLQAPLTIDYDAVVDSINDLDTNTIPEGGTNISEAINLAVRTYGKSAVGNRALIIFTDGEELGGDANKAAKAAADAGVRIFTIGVGTPQGSLITISGEDGGTAFVKNSKGQVVKSKLDEKRLHEVADATGGLYLHLENGSRTMQQVIERGLGKMQAGEIDARLARRPIERYEWPLAAASLALATSLLINDRKKARMPASSHSPAAAEAATLAAGIVVLSAISADASAPGLDAYRQEKFAQAYEQFQQTLKEHPQTRAADKIQFDAGAAAYKMKDYKKALESFSQALLSPDTGLQGSSHYNLGNTLYERGEAEKKDEKKLTDWTNALQHYEQTLKVQPQNKEAKDNYEFVKKKIEELKKKQEQQPTPTPTPSPSPSPQSNKDQKRQDRKDQQQNQNKQDQNQQQQGNSGNEKQEQKKSESNGSDKEQKPESGTSPSPSPGESPSSSPSASPSPSAGEGEQKQEEKPEQGASPSPNVNRGESSPSPTPGEDNEQGEKGATPTATPVDSPPKKFAGEVKGAPGENSKNPPQAAEAEPIKEGEMSPDQAERLLESMKDEEQRVQLDERKASRHVYNDW